MPNKNLCAVRTSSHTERASLASASHLPFAGTVAAGAMTAPHHVPLKEEEAAILQRLRSELPPDVDAKLKHSGEDGLDDKVRRS